MLPESACSQHSTAQRFAQTTRLLVCSVREPRLGLGAPSVQVQVQAELKAGGALIRRGSRPQNTPRERIISLRGWAPWRLLLEQGPSVGIRELVGEDRKQIDQGPDATA